jgi:hypothetical protein
MLFCAAYVLMDKPYAFLLFGAAHGLQYHLLVTLTLSIGGQGTRARAAVLSKIAFTIIAIGVVSAIGWVAFQYYYASSEIGIRIIVGLISAVALIHFWVDAFVWKLSDAAVRQMHGKVLAF